MLVGGGAACMQETTSTTTAPPVMEVVVEEEEERYVQVASRFFRVKPRGGGGAVATGFHYLGSCFLCKERIACDRDVFMYKGDAAFCSDECRQEQMDMDEALHAVARRHSILRAPSPSSTPAEAVPSSSSSRPPAMRRRPTIANLAARSAPLAAS